MGFSCGLVGLPNAGKSTVFNALTRLGVEASPYPFCTIDPHHGIVPLEDPSLYFLRKAYSSAKKTPTSLEFIDIAGLVQGASQGEGLGNLFLSHIRTVDAVVHVVRCFQDEKVSHPCGSLDPVRDASLVTTELILKDLETVENHLAKIRTMAKSGNPQAHKESALLESLAEHLSSDREIRSFSMTEDLRTLVQELNLLTAKPVILIANVDELHISGSPEVQALTDHAAAMNSPCIVLGGKVHSEIVQLASEDQKTFLAAMGLESTALQTVVKTGYRLLDLLTFYTANENEARAWTLKRGASMLEAAGKVHSDFARDFIRAEVITMNNLHLHGNPKNLHDLGLIVLAGKEAVVQDGDVLFFRTKK